MTVTARSLKAEELRLRYEELLADASVFPTKANWDYIIENRMEGIGALLMQKYLTALHIDDVDRVELHQVAVDEFPRYLEAIERDYALEVVYGNTSDKRAFVDLVRRCRLFDADYLIDMIRCDGLSPAIEVLDVYQPEYDEASLEAMKRLLAFFDELPRLGRYENRQGLFGSSVKYICPAGHVGGDASTVYCQHSGCGLDVRGLTESQAKAVGILAHRVKALGNLLS